jgi:trans-aconitate 2-methyltransferase
VSGDAWDPRQYERFREERREPFLDLLGLVRPRPGMRVVDLGCGTGELTRLLHERLGARETLGIDRSPAMLAKSEGFAAPGLRFAAGDLEALPAVAAWDLVFSNAAFHWVPDHPALLARLTAALLPGGQLAFQVPANFDHASHRLVGEVAAEEPFRTALGGWSHRADAVLRPEEYALLLDRLGYAAPHVRLQVYVHRLAGPEDVVEWLRGTLLTAYRRRLGEEVYAAFLARYRERLGSRLEDRRPFPFTFKRILAWARRPGAP